MQNVIRNSFFSPESRSKGTDYSNDLVEVFELQEIVIKGPNFDNDPSDFVIDKRPVKVDSYHHNKVVAERCKGQDLESIISKLQRTGDVSLINQKEVIYGDDTIRPHTLGEALEKKVLSEIFLDSLSEEKKSELLKVSKMSKDELDAYIKKIVDERIGKAKPGGEPQPEGQE